MVSQQISLLLVEMLFLTSCEVGKFTATTICGKLSNVAKVYLKFDAGP